MGGGKSGNGPSVLCARRIVARVQAAELGLALMSVYSALYSRFRNVQSKLHFRLCERRPRTHVPLTG